MSLSRIASMRFQSVLDRLFVFFALFMICLSPRDDANRSGSAFRKDHNRNALANRADRSPTAFLVVLVRVGTDEEHSTKHYFSIGKVEPVLSNVCAVLGLIPFQSHCNSKCSYIEARLLNSHTPRDWPYLR